MKRTTFCIVCHSAKPGDRIVAEVWNGSVGDAYSGRGWQGRYALATPEDAVLMIRDLFEIPPPPERTRTSVRGQKGRFVRATALKEVKSA